MVIWITGLSGAGKTTLSLALRDLIKPMLPQTVLIDGDTVREIFGSGLAYSEPERRSQIERIQGLARILSNQEQIVIVSALYSHPEISAWNRNNLSEYFEVYLQASMKLLRNRDQKNLYTQIERGEINNVVGVDIRWHTPTAPDLLFNADKLEPPQTLARKIVENIPVLSSILDSNN